MGQNDWMLGGARQYSQRKSDRGYDVMQICLNGHQITDSAESLPDHKKDFCPNCGEKTIIECPACNAKIQGHLNRSMSSKSAPIPNNCHACGTAYPWRLQSIAASIEILEMELHGQDLSDATSLIKDISVDTPKTEISALKLNKILKTLSKPVYDVAIKVIADLSVAAAKSHFGIKT